MRFGESLTVNLNIVLFQCSRLNFGATACTDLAGAIVFRRARVKSEENAPDASRRRDLYYCYLCNFPHAVPSMAILYLHATHNKPKLTITYIYRYANAQTQEKLFWVIN